VEEVRLVNQAGRKVPAIVYPDGTRVELGPGDVVNDPGAIKAQLGRWLNAWVVIRSKLVEPETGSMEDVSEVLKDSSEEV